MLLVRSLAAHVFWLSLSQLGRGGGDRRGRIIARFARMRVAPNDVARLRTFRPGFLDRGPKQLWAPAGGPILRPRGQFVGFFFGSRASFYFFLLKLAGFKLVLVSGSLLTHLPNSPLYLRQVSRAGSKDRRVPYNERVNLFELLASSEFRRLCDPCVFRPLLRCG